MSCLSHHHARGSSDVGMAGIFLYNSISCCSLAGIGTALPATANLFRALSSASKSSSSGDNFGRLENGAWEMKMRVKRHQEIGNYASQNVQVTSSEGSCCSETVSLDTCRLNTHKDVNIFRTYRKQEFQKKKEQNLVCGFSEGLLIYLEARKDKLQLCTSPVAVRSSAAFSTLCQISSESILFLNLGSMALASCRKVQVSPSCQQENKV